MLPEDILTLRHLIDFINGQAISDHRKRDMISAICRVGEMLCSSPEDVPLDVPELRRLLRTIRPAAHSITRKTLSNIRSLIYAALVLSGRADAAQRGFARRHPEWGGLMSAASTRKDLASGLGAFANWCAARDIAPKKVSDRTLQDFLTWLEKRTLHPKPCVLVRGIPILWERASSSIEDWPGTRFGRLSFKRPSNRLSWSKLPRAFQRDVDAYNAKRRHPDLFDESDWAPRRALAEGTLRLQREHLRLAASILANEAGHPVDQITSLECLTRPEAFKAILRHFVEQASRKSVENAKREGDLTAAASNQHPPNAFVVGLARTLIQVAQYHTKATPDEISALKKWAGRLTPVPFDLVPKNAFLLRQLEPKQTRAKLLFLPERLLTEVIQDQKVGRFRFVDAQCAIAIDILLAVPLRPKNLSALEWRRHFQELETSGPLLLHIPAAETKTRKKDLVAEIPEDVARRIRWYRRVVLPQVGGDQNGCLFVSQHGTRKDQKTLAGQIISCIARHVGIHMTPHQFRHFAAVSYLEENPEDFETARALLGHAFGKTTRIYAGSSTRRAGRAYARFLFESRDTLRLQQPIRGPRRRQKNGIGS